MCPHACPEPRRKRARPHECRAHRCVLTLVYVVEAPQGWGLEAVIGTHQFIYHRGSPRLQEMKARCRVAARPRGHRPKRDGLSNLGTYVAYHATRSRLLYVALLSVRHP